MKHYTDGAVPIGTKRERIKDNQIIYPVTEREAKKEKKYDARWADFIALVGSPL